MSTICVKWTTEILLLSVHQSACTLLIVICTKMTREWQSAQAQWIDLPINVYSTTKHYQVLSIYSSSSAGLRKNSISFFVLSCHPSKKESTNAATWHECEHKVSLHFVICMRVLLCTCTVQMETTSFPSNKFCIQLPVILINYEPSLVWHGKVASNTDKRENDINRNPEVGVS